MNKNTKLILMAGGAVALTYALMEYYKKNVKGDATGTPTVPETDPLRASSFTASDDFFSNYVSDDFFGFTANEPFMQASGGGFFSKFKKKKGSAERQTQTRCATNLERLAMLFPDTNQYNAELGKAYAREGANFNSWAMAKSNPCFVVGVERGGLQSGTASFTASDNFFNAGGGGVPSLGNIFGGKSKAKPSSRKTLTPNSKPFFSKSKGSKETGLADLQFTANDNFFNAGGIPVATDEPNFKY